MRDVVTIIVPVYNVEDYLQKCVDSILGQKYNRLQIILVDDGSIDSSSAICDEYAKKDSRIEVLHKKNGGLSSARNAGLDIAKGKYVAFIDSDDYVSPNYVSTMIRLMGDAAERIVCVGFKEFENEKNINEYYMPTDMTIKTYNGFEAVMSLFRSDGAGDWAWNKLYPLHLFNGIRFPIGRKMEDLGTVYLLFEKCKDVVFCSTPFYWYRQRPDSILHCPDKKFFVDKYDLSKKRYQNLIKSYGDIKENYKFMMDVIFECHRYLNFSERQWAEHELDIIIKKIHMCPKAFVKYMILKCSKNLLYFLQGDRT